MTTYRFAITGLRHHDFANRLDELYDKAMGKRMSISIEHDNPGEMDAVIVYWGRCFVGYVRSGTDREKCHRDRSMTSRIIHWQMSQWQVIDIMTYNSYSLQYYSFRKGKIGFTRTGFCFLDNANSHQALQLTVDSFQKRFFCVTATVLQFLKRKNRFRILKTRGQVSVSWTMPIHTRRYSWQLTVSINEFFALQITDNR